MNKQTFDFAGAVAVAINPDFKTLYECFVSFHLLNNARYLVVDSVATASAAVAGITPAKSSVYSSPCSSLNDSYDSPSLFFFL